MLSFPVLSGGRPRACATLLSTALLASLGACGGGGGDTPATATASTSATASDTTTDTASGTATGTTPAMSAAGVVAADQLPSVESRTEGLPTDLQLLQQQRDAAAQASQGV